MRKSNNDVALVTGAKGIGLEIARKDQPEASSAALTASLGNDLTSHI